MTMIKNVYQTDSAVKIYKDTHCVPSKYRKNKLDQLYNELQELIETISKSGNSLRIADIGIGQGDTLIPFVERTLVNFPDLEIDIIGIDNSELQLNNLKVLLSENEYQLTKDNFFIKDEKIKLELVNGDIEDEKVFSKLKGKYDIVFIDYLLHHLLNWRVGLLRILFILKEGGAIIFSNRLNDIEFIDGNFKNFDKHLLDTDNSKSEFYKLLNDYHLLKKQYFYWNPEVRATDHSEVFNFLQPIFDNSSNFKLEYSYDTSLKTIISWIEQKSLTHFWIGSIPDGKLNDLLDKFKGDNNDGKFELNDGEKIYVLKGFNNKLQRLDFDYNNILFKIIDTRIKDYSSIPNLSQYFLDLAITHDVLFSDKSYLFGVHPWNLLNNTWQEPFSVIFNKNVFSSQPNNFKYLILNYFIYLKTITSFNFSINKYLFRINKYKFNFKILLTNENQIEEQTKFDEENIIKRVDISIPKRYRSNSLKFEKIDEVYDYLLKKEIHIKSGLVSLSFDMKLIDELFNKFSDLIKVVDNFYETNDYKQFYNDLESKPFYIFSDIETEQKQKLIKAIYAIINFFLKEDLSITYLPSKVISYMKEDVGFGGLILLEKTDSTLKLNNNFNQIYTKLERTRDKSLILTNNLLFSKLAVISWADKNNFDLSLHATKSAIAAIMSRNMSHNLGSHVLSYASTGLNHPFDVQVLMEYMQERMDFIAQITAEPPQWTMTMRFVSQLMRNFYKQRILLNYISKSEGLSAKEYQIGNKDENKLQVIVLDNKGNEIIPNGNNTNFEDPLVAIPGGITGAHAFYTILENIIRNAAKHSFNKIENNEGLKIYVQIDDSDNNNVTVKVFDNVTKNILTNQKDTDGSKMSLFQVIENKLKQSLIEQTGSLRYENWGLAEIKIGAGFLNKKKQDEIGGGIEDISKSFIKLIDPKKDKNGTTLQKPDLGSFIGYEFNIQKPKYVLIILKDQINGLDKNDELENGIYLKTYEEIKDESKLDYEFVLFQKDLVVNSLESKFPKRVFTFDNVFLNQFSKIITIKECLAFQSDKKNGNNEDGEDINLEKIDTVRIELYKTWINCLLANNNKKKIVVELEVLPYENYSGGSSISNIEAYKYSVEALLKSFSNNDGAYNVFKKFLNNSNPNIANDLFKELIKTDKSAIAKLIDKKSTVVDMFKKYEEDIETLPGLFKETTPNQDPKETSSSKDSEEESSDQDSNEEDTNFFKHKYPFGNNFEVNGNGNKNGVKEIFIKYKRHVSDKTDKDYYVEALSGCQSYFGAIENFVKSNNINDELAYQLIETGLLYITVVDERVYDFYSGNPQIQKRFDSVNIRVLKDLSGLKSDTETTNKDILIIHQGIIDKINEFNESIKTFLSNFTYRYITSGSGDKKSGNNDNPFLKDFKFIPFSNVRSALIRQYPEKYILIQTLMKI